MDIWRKRLHKINSSHGLSLMFFSEKQLCRNGEKSWAWWERETLLSRISSSSNQTSGHSKRYFQKNLPLPRPNFTYPIRVSSFTNIDCYLQSWLPHTCPLVNSIAIVICTLWILTPKYCCLVLISGSLELMRQTLRLQLLTHFLKMVDGNWGI